MSDVIVLHDIKWGCLWDLRIESNEIKSGHPWELRVAKSKEWFHERRQKIDRDIVSTWKELRHTLRHHVTHYQDRMPLRNENWEQRHQMNHIMSDVIGLSDIKRGCPWELRIYNNKIKRVNFWELIIENSGMKGMPFWVMSSDWTTSNRDVFENWE